MLCRKRRLKEDTELATMLVNDYNIPYNNIETYTFQNAIQGILIY